MRKDYDDDWSFEPPPKSLFVWREFSSKKTHTSCLREKREKRERKKRAVHRKRSAKKKNEKTRSRHSLFCEVSLKKRKEKEVLFYCSQTVVKLFRKVHSQRAYFLSSFIVPRTHTHPTTPNTHTRRMTDSKRSNAAGEKYALRGIYGSEPYWPQEKLKICVTGAGGFIGET